MPMGRTRTNLRDEWQTLLHERYSYGQEVYKLLDRWTSKVYQEMYRTITEDDGSDEGDEGGKVSETGEEQAGDEQTSASARIMQGKQFATPNYFKVEPCREALLDPRCI